MHELDHPKNMPSLNIDAIEHKRTNYLTYTADPAPGAEVETAEVAFLEHSFDQ